MTRLLVERASAAGHRSLVVVAGLLRDETTDQEPTTPPRGALARRADERRYVGVLRELGYQVTLRSLATD